MSSTTSATTDDESSDSNQQQSGPQPTGFRRADKLSPGDNLVVVAGTRDILDQYSEAVTRFLVENAMDRAPFPVDAVVSGGADGPDTAGEVIADRYKMPVAEFEADWDNTDHPDAVVREGEFGEYNARAGFIRNEQMARYGDALVAVWNGESGGTRNMIENARQHMGDSDIYVLVYNDPETDDDSAEPGIYVGAGLNYLL